MAILGLTKLQAVNKMLNTLQQGRVTSLSSTGSWPSRTYSTDPDGFAEELLDVVSGEIQSQGPAACTARNKKYTVASPGNITFASTVVRILACGPTENKSIVLRADKAYDLDNDTDTFAAGDYFFHVTSVLDFENLVPELKVLVSDLATLQYYNLKGSGDPRMLGYLQEKVAQAYLNVKGLNPPVNPPTPSNPVMMAPASSQRQ